MERLTVETDVVVVGAGAAGLTAARMLSEAGLRTTVVEADDHVGGRLQTIDLDGRPVDVGGQWLGPRHTALTALVEEAGKTIIQTPTSGNELHFYGGERLTDVPPDVQELYQKLGEISATVPLAAPWTHPDAKALDHQTLAAWLNRNAKNPTAAAYARRMLGGGLLAGAAEESLLETGFYINSNGGIEELLSTTGGAQESRVAEGMQSVMLYLADLLAQRGSPVRLNEPVQRIAQTDSTVTVSTEKADYIGSHAIVAMPPLSAGRIEFSPALPTQRNELMQHMVAGYALKSIIFYEKPFWPNLGWSGTAFTSEGPVAEAYPNADDCLVAFSYGEDATALRALSPNQRRAAILGHIGEIFDDKRAVQLVSKFINKDWTTESQFIPGCFSGHFRPGGWTAYGPALREPNGRISWAGSETSERDNGYINGAILSGLREAAAVLAARG
jgi:monoamine oxidase